MAGELGDDSELFSCVSLEERVSRRHPLRRMRRPVDEARRNLDYVFADRYLELAAS